ncbi:hypothetical protein Tco_1571877, partial [Tanacetum coccineum]
MGQVYPLRMQIRNSLDLYLLPGLSSTASSSSTQNVAFVSENTSSTNDLDEFDLEEMDLKWQGILLESANPRGIKIVGGEMLGTLGKKDNENGRRYGKQEDSKALVTLDGEGVDWTSHSEDKQENYASIACNSLGSDTK